MELMKEKYRAQHTIKFYLIGGTTIELKECSEKTCGSVQRFLVDDELKVFRADNQVENKSTLIRKDTVLFVEVF